MKDSGVVSMLKASKIEGKVENICYIDHSQPAIPTTDLHCMFKLFHRVEAGLQCIVKCLSFHLRETGCNIVTEEPGAEAQGRSTTSCIQNLLQLHDQYMIFLEKSFESNELFQRVIQSVSPKEI